MDSAGGPFLSLLAANLFALLAISHLILGRALHYSTLAMAVAPSAVHLAFLLPLVFAAAFLHERLVRGELYAWLRRRMAAGWAAPAVAFLGAIGPAVLRLTVLPRPRAPILLVASQAVLVELFLGLGLAWLALGSGSSLPGGLALSVIWTVRLVFVATFYGGAMPLIEVVAAGAAAMSVAMVLRGPLAPHRDAVLGAA